MTVGVDIYQAVKYIKKCQHSVKSSFFNVLFFGLLKRPVFHFVSKDGKIVATIKL